MKKRHNGGNKENVVHIGNQVTIKNVDTPEVSTYILVHPNDADLSSGRISIHSPLAQGIMGCKLGKLALVPLRDGPVTFKIIRVEPAKP